MNREQILAAVRNLAMSQGFYGRLYEQLVNNEEALAYLEEQNFGSTLDLVLFLEQ